LKQIVGIGAVGNLGANVAEDPRFGLKQFADELFRDFFALAQSLFFRSWSF
jgi:hypothetical protein